MARTYLADDSTEDARQGHRYVVRRHRLLGGFKAMSKDIVQVDSTNKYSEKIVLLTFVGGQYSLL